MSLAIVDSGVANLGSVRAAFARLGVEVEVTRDADRIRAADRVVLPGVGAYDAAIDALQRAGLYDVLRTLERPLLGICLGMQLLYEGSDEGEREGLGVLPGRARRLAGRDGARVPHMGWNTLEPVGAGSMLTRGIDRGDHAYFVHSYAVAPDAHTLVASTHGERFAAIVGRGRVYGAQFHPERSSATGARLLQNFLETTA